MEKEKSKVMLGLLFITIGIFALLTNYIQEKRELVFSSINLELSEILAQDELVATSQTEEVSETTDTSLPQEITPVTDETETTSTPAVNYETYIGILEIPKIGFSKGFYKKESSLNNVKFNLKILADSDYPDKENGNVIIIGHSGNYNNSYFANLYQLNLEDTASITYQGKKYTYKIVNIYTDTKDGTVTLYRNELKSCLTLITCTKDDDTKQTIYILELVSVE